CPRGERGRRGALQRVLRRRPEPGGGEARRVGERSMSRIGKKPVAIPSGVTATIAGQKVTIKGPKGELTFTCPEQIRVAQTAEGIEVTPVDDSKTARAMWGMSRTQIANL